jgi:hypothetical protein
MNALARIFMDHAGKPSFTRTMGAFLVLVPLAVWAGNSLSAGAIQPAGDALTLIAAGLAGKVADNMTGARKPQEVKTDGTDIQV